MKSKLVLLALHLLIIFPIVLGSCNHTTPWVLPMTPSIIQTRLGTLPDNIQTFTVSSRPSISTTITITVTRTPHPTFTSSWTPRPTLPPGQAQVLALNIIRTNGNCLFPCWLGMVPGETRWNDIYAYFGTFADRIISADDGHYGIFLKFPPGSTRLNLYGMDIHVTDGIIDRIQTNTAILTREDYTLSYLLSTYGPPTEIRIRAVGLSTLDSRGDYTVALFYGNKGILAVYGGYTNLGKIMRVCPDNTDGAGTWLFWDTNKEITFEEAATFVNLMSPQSPNLIYPPLKDAAGITVDDFYQKYKDPANRYDCFEMTATK
jgi:hypothetical protein